MFDATHKFNVLFKNTGTEPVYLKTTFSKNSRVVSGPVQQLLEPGETIVLLGYEPGVTYSIEPALRDSGYAFGALDPVPVEFGKPGVIESAAVKEENGKSESDAS